MNEQQVITQLRAFAGEVSAWPFDTLRALENRRYFREFEGADGNSVELEAEYLEDFVEGGVKVLHIPVLATAGMRVFSIELFIEATGKVRWNGNVYEFVGGIPQVAWSQSESTHISDRPEEGRESDA